MSDWRARHRNAGPCPLCKAATGQRCKRWDARRGTYHGSQVGIHLERLTCCTHPGTGLCMCDCHGEIAVVPGLTPPEGLPVDLI